MKPIFRTLLLGTVDCPVDRQRIFTLWLGTTFDWPVDRFSLRSKIQPLAVDRPIDRQQSFLLSWLPMASFKFVFFLGLVPTALLCFLVLFSSLINSGTMKQLNNKIFKPYIKVLQVLASLQKISL